MKSVIWLWDSIGTIHVTGKFSAKDNWSETLIPGKLASRLIRGKNIVNTTIGRKILSELTEDPTYVNPTYPRFVVLKTINIIGTAAFCPSWAKIRLTRVRLIRGLLYLSFKKGNTSVNINILQCGWVSTLGSSLFWGNYWIGWFKINKYVFVFFINIVGWHLSPSAFCNGVLPAFWHFS